MALPGTYIYDLLDLLYRNNKMNFIPPMIILL